MTGRLEHVNITVSDPKKTARWLSDLFGWKIRWQGEAKDNGFTVHVGGDDNYIAVYATGRPDLPQATRYVENGSLNHVGVVGDDLDAIEAKVKALGYETHSHADYEPGRRFYFFDGDDIEWEVVSYA